jgi:4-methyl-5(b-hydroxyethyl)-thiazole monophosphate biosynthesis
MPSGCPLTALILIAQGFETDQALIPLDYFARANLNVTLARSGPSPNITDMAGITYRIPKAVENVTEENFGVVLVPGGNPGAWNLANDPTVIDIIQNQSKSKCWLASIGGATWVVLGGAANVLANKTACGYPGTDANSSQNWGSLSTDPIVIDDTLITARGSGVVQAFALSIVEKLCGQSVSLNLAMDLQIINPSYPTPTDLPWQSETDWRIIAIICTVLAVALFAIAAFAVHLYATANKPGKLDFGG